MNCKATYLLLLLILALTACEPFDVIGDDMFGWMPGYQRSSAPSSNTAPQTQQPSAPAAPTNTVDMEKFCAKMPNTHYDGSGCVCNDGFVSSMGVCVKGSSPTSAKECVFDQDCSPSGSDKMVCDGTRFSLRYRCDLRTNTCIPRKGVAAERIDCTVDFGPEYSCTGSGLCTR